ncbi:MAG TPA: TraR/DksA family transcriptional regulator [Bryobacteraceae bacterium]|nr:TraR/DksA family transcriptional regulator [Bryobacteraceae bacterium]
MKTLDLKNFEFALQTRAEELARALAERNQIAIERSADTFDATLLAAERESSAQVLAHDSRLLRQIEAARVRLRDGTFGVCLRCEEEITPKRLEAIPWAAYCLSCQAMAESEVLPAGREFARAA